MEENNKVTLNAFALVGFILGLLSMIIYWLLGIVPILAIIFSSIALFKTKIKGYKEKSIAIIGLVLGILFTAQFGIMTF